MPTAELSPDFDVFISYRWVEPDQTWVRNNLVPALEAAGLKVFLDVKDFVPGRDLLLEMDRAGQSSRRTLCVLSEDYLAGNRMVHFESLNARRRDPGGLDSRLVPLVLRPTALPDWLQGLVPVDWTDERTRTREWNRLMSLLQAKSDSLPPGSPYRLSHSQALRKTFLHDYNLARRFVGRSSELRQVLSLLTKDTSTARVVAVTAIGGTGKSCLCREILERPEIEARFARVIWFSFYESRAEAEGYFLQEVLRALCNVDGDGHDGTAQRLRLRRTLFAELDREPALLVLDGLETTQFTDNPASAEFGSIKPAWSEVERLLRHVLNGASSACLVTTRLSIRDLETTRGYHQICLDLFSPKDGAILLRSLGVHGPNKALRSCSQILGGHALSLVAAGRHLARRGISADRLHEVIADPASFQGTSEGEKVKRIVEWYRSELTSAQEYFLTRLSLHGRSVSSGNYPVLVQHYAGPERNAAIADEIIQPLLEKGLIEQVAGSDGITRFTAHPLMKLAYSTWLDAGERNQAHLEWARAALAGPPILFSALKAKNLDELQPLLDAAEQYIAAGNWREAWQIYSVCKLGERLGYLGHFELSAQLARRFEEERERSGSWTASDSVALFDLLAWLADRLENEDQELNYRRKELAVARQGQIWNLDEVESAVATSLVSAGFVLEAATINPSEPRAQGCLALAQGDYTRATSLLSAAFTESKGHGRSVVAQSLAEALYRSGHLEEAAQTLGEGLQFATDGGFSCCQKHLLWQLIDLSLRRRDVAEARRYADRRKELLQRLDLVHDEHPWLLLCEGDVEGALRAADSSKQDCPRSQIDRHIQRVRILHRLGRIEESAIELTAAESCRDLNGYKQFDNDILALRREVRT